MPIRILVIEDHPVNMEMIVSTLQAFGYQPIQATTGRAGLDLARLERPDAILCDLHLPDVDGLFVAKTLKADAALSRIPLIGVSADAAADTQQTTDAAGFDAYLTKPLDFNCLLSTLRQFVDQKKA